MSRRYGLREIMAGTWRVITVPASWHDACAYVTNDIRALFGHYSYEFPLLFIAGLPKSGTTWVETQLARVPGYNIRGIDDPDGVTKNHDICDTVFSSLPKNRYTVLRLHTRYTPDNLQIIQRHVNRFMVMIRDLRDMCISRYFDVRARATHRHHELYSAAPLEDGLTHCIKIVEAEYVKWVQDWVQIARENPDAILLVTYEKLNRFPESTFADILAFFHLPTDNHLVENLARSKQRSHQDLQVNLGKKVTSLSIRATSTARKGAIGSWKEYFSPPHKKLFKEIAGDLLIDLEYEQGLNW